MSLWRALERFWLLRSSSTENSFPMRFSYVNFTFFSSLLFAFSSSNFFGFKTTSSFIFFSTASSCKVDRRALCASRGRLRGKSYTIQSNVGSVLSCCWGVEKVLVCCEMLFNTERNKNLRTLDSERDNCQKEEGKKLNSNRFSFLWTLKHTPVALYKASRRVSIYSRRANSLKVGEFWISDLCRAS